jgi:hypothetical protein
MKAMTRTVVLKIDDVMLLVSVFFIAGSAYTFLTF